MMLTLKLHFLDGGKEMLDDGPACGLDVVENVAGEEIGVTKTGVLVVVVGLGY